jgi:hypothetical protein
MRYLIIGWLILVGILILLGSCDNTDHRKATVNDIASGLDSLHDDYDVRAQYWISVNGLDSALYYYGKMRAISDCMTVTHNAATK